MYNIHPSLPPPPSLSHPFPSPPHPTPPLPSLPLVTQIHCPFQPQSPSQLIVYKLVVLIIYVQEQNRQVSS